MLILLTMLILSTMLILITILLLLAFYMNEIILHPPIILKINTSMCSFHI